MCAFFNLLTKKKTESEGGKEDEKVRKIDDCTDRLTTQIQQLQVSFAQQQLQKTNGQEIVEVSEFV